MLNNVIEDKDFLELMQGNIQNMIIHLFEKEQNFGILCKIQDASFDPELPVDINAEFRPMTLFFLAGYTFDSARIVEGNLVFEAGFGADNIGSVVSVPLLSIMQVIIDETPILINLSSHKRMEKIFTNNTDKKDEVKGVENSMASFLSNPENSKFLK